MPMWKEAYPSNWREIAFQVKQSAGWICQRCGRQCRKPGEPFDSHRRTMSVHHLGVAKPDGSEGDSHDKLDCRPENLLALCSACHLLLDLPIHMRHAAETRLRRKRAAGQLVFELEVTHGIAAG